MINSYKTYCVAFKGTVAAGANTNNAGGIKLLNQPVNVKSFWWDILITETVNLVPLPIATQNTQVFTVTIGDYTWAEGWQGLLDDFSDAPNAYNNGNRIISFRPQQMIFNQLFCGGGIQIGFTYYNYAAALSYNFKISMFVEVEMLPYNYGY